MGFALHGMIKFSLYKSLICCFLNISLQLFYIIGKYRRKCISGRETAGVCILCSKMVCRKKKVALKRMAWPGKGSGFPTALRCAGVAS